MSKKIFVAAIVDQNLATVREVAAKSEGDDRTALVLTLNYIEDLQANLRAVQPSLINAAKFKAVSTIVAQLGLPAPQWAGEDSFLELPEQPPAAPSPDEVPTPSEETQEVIDVTPSEQQKG